MGTRADRAGVRAASGDPAHHRLAERSSDGAGLDFFPRAAFRLDTTAQAQSATAVTHGDP